MKIRKIVIVDDDRWLAEQQASFLASKGYQVRCCFDALSALNLVEEDLPDLLILDVVLASTTIFNLIHELKSYTDTNKIPIILSTNVADRLRNVDLRPYGVKLVLDKATTSPKDLLLAVGEIVG